MALLAMVAYPTLAERDRAWLESLRTRHDPQARRLQAHFTLVFPFEMVEESAVEHAKAALGRLEPIPFVLRRAVAMADVVGGGSHVFLVPEEGRAQLVSLHDRLYVGLLAPYLRADIPFVPHVTVGAFEDLEASDQLAAALNRETVCVQGSVSRIHVIELGANGVHTLAELPS